jgi:F-type H+-transporting ATPase subunit delta
MSSVRLANRYAKALMDLAREQGQLEEVTADVRRMDEVIRANADLLMLLRSPIIQPARKMPILEKVFSGVLQEVMMNFMQILVRKHREEHLPEICKVYLQRYNELRKIKSVRITSAAPIEPALHQRIAESLREADEASIELETVVDPDLIGGYIIRYGDKEYDASVVRNLRRLRKEFDENVYVKKY